MLALFASDLLLERTISHAERLVCCGGWAETCRPVVVVQSDLISMLHSFYDNGRQQHTVKRLTARNRLILEPPRQLAESVDCPLCDSFARAVAVPTVACHKRTQTLPLARTARGLRWLSKLPKTPSRQRDQGRQHAATTHAHCAYAHAHP